MEVKMSEASEEDQQNKQIREFLSCLFGLGFLKAALLEEILSTQFALWGCSSGDEVVLAEGEPFEGPSASALQAAV